MAGLNRSVRLELEQAFGDVTVLGEISDLTRAGSGHVYFTLNDEREQAQLRVVLFRNDARRSRVPLEPGARVCVRGNVTLYEPRGTYQFLARSVEPAGEGDLAAQFRRLLEKLTAEGLIDRPKRPLPLLPRCVGLVTSEHGAALHDVLRVAHERCPVRIVVAPCLVQGADAPRAIVVALRALSRVRGLDVVIVARGGGSAEDLWAFNDEAVARAIATYPVPVVSGIGHEVDTTIADLVADVRAATPSNAAERVVPARVDLAHRLSALVRGLARAEELTRGRKRHALNRVSTQLRDPRRLLSRASQRLDELDARLARAMRTRIQGLHVHLDETQLRLAPHDPRARLARRREALSRLSTRCELSAKHWLTPVRAEATARDARLRRALLTTLTAQRHALAANAAKLHALSPLAVLARGYAIALSEQTGRALRTPSDTRVGDRLRLKLHGGDVHAEVVPE
ncbi:MAG: exodeoxyribonuclease VII large subunit [Polyangiales bacterium]